MKAFRPAKRAVLLLVAVWVPVRLAYWYLAIEPDAPREWRFVIGQSLFDTFVVWAVAAGVVWLVLRLFRRRRAYKGLLFTPAVVLPLLGFDLVRFALDAGDLPI